MYDKAAQMLERHKSGKSPQYHRVSGSEYLVLTTYGVDQFKKVTPKLVERYRQAYQTHIMRISHVHIICITHIGITLSDTRMPAVSTETHSCVCLRVPHSKG